MTTYRSDGSAIHLPGLAKRLTWLVGFAELVIWMKRVRKKYRVCVECGVAIPRERYDAHAVIHKESAG